MKRMKGKIADYLPMAVTTLAWGTMGIPGKAAIAALPPLFIMGMRCLIASLFLAFFILRERQPLVPPQEDRLTILLNGLIGVFANNYLYFLALRWTSLTNCAVLFATTPAMTALLARIFLGEPLGAKRVLGILLAFLGVVLLLTGGNLRVLSLSTFNRGDLAELGAAFCAALLAILGRKVRQTPPTTAIFNMMIVGGALAFGVFFLTGSPLPGMPSPAVWGSLMHLGLFSSCLGYLCQQISLKRIGAAASTAFLNAVPAITILAAYLVLGETISVVQAFSTLAIFSGVYLNVRSR